MRHAPAETVYKIERGRKTEREEGEAGGKRERARERKGEEREKEMESQPILCAQRVQCEAQRWVSVRRWLLRLFWGCCVTLAVVACVMVVRAYEPPPQVTWYQRHALCYIPALHSGNLTEVAQRMHEVSVLGCGGLILGIPPGGGELKDLSELSVGSLVAEGQRHGLRILLELQVPSKGNGSQTQELWEAAWVWIREGVSGFRLSHGERATVIEVTEKLREELGNVTGDERILLLPNWLCEAPPPAWPHLLRSCPLPRGDLQEVIEGPEVMETAWEAPPSWLRSLLFLRSQHPALSSGSLRFLSNGSSYYALRHQGCSAILVALSQSNRPQSLSVHIPQYNQRARCLLSTWAGRGVGEEVDLSSLVLAPYEGVILRLAPA
ncbi:uncharacterized protein LOC142499444 isoform X2 [Ascaphus truei]|uniref:uncharacterized protein LOC142499444 isoform X2 n=1 Tax=Ascaphus truei TaxID=8439 RepID=UPI003F59A985